jgi:hypothetical protein
LAPLVITPVNGVTSNRPAKPGLFLLARNALRYGFEDGESAMKHWIGAMALTALVTLGGKSAIDPAAAASTAPRTIHSARSTDLSSHRRHHHTTRHTRYGTRTYGRPYYYGPTYLARPVMYAPAPFPLGFGFGFFW